MGGAPFAETDKSSHSRKQAQEALSYKAVGLGLVLAFVAGIASWLYAWATQAEGRDLH